MNPKITLTFSKADMLQMALTEAFKFEPFFDHDLSAEWLYADDGTDDVIGLEVSIDNNEGKDLV